ncbi:MAG: dTDP-glucose 4,6-dehydratase [Lentisphaeria bacterium]|nr:dTDP-glucose 4,6-dehydratase [Lentisphaeria bacterium]
MNIIVTGGAGFIGSSFLLKCVRDFPEHMFINVDALTYAGNPFNLSSIAAAANYAFEHADITDLPALRKIFAAWEPDAVIHFAAESHVDRSLVGPAAFVRTNVIGTFHLLECCRERWLGKETAPARAGDTRPMWYHRFHHVSTDEVFGSLGDDGKFTETTPYDPSSPYSASKAGSDHLVRAYQRSYGLNTSMTNCSNNYGPRHFPEKLIPLMILNALEGKPLPVYGKGANVRDWLYVDDHADAIWAVFSRAEAGRTYNVGGDCEMRNIDVVDMICDLVEKKTGKANRRDLITFVKDRPGHDFRYAMDIAKIRRDLNWRPKETFASGLEKTVQWYLDNPDWVENVRSGDYRRWLETNYAER